MPEKGQYKLIFDGGILAGHDLNDVKTKLAGLLKSDSKKIERLLASAPLTIKKNIDYPTASKFKEALRTAGASCQIERIENNVRDATPPPLAQIARSAQPKKIQAGDGAEEASSKTKIRPSWIWYVIAFLLTAVPIVFAGIKIPLVLLSNLASGIEITAPGAVEFTIDQPDKYIIWYTTYDGQSHHRDIPQDIKIVIYNHNTDRYLNVSAAGREKTETVLDVERQSIAEVVFEQAGVYTIEVSGEFPATDLVLRRSLMIYYIASTLLILIIIGFILFIGLFIFNIIIVIKAGIKANEGEFFKYPMTIRFFT